MYDASPDHGDPAREARRRANLHRPRGTPVRRSQFRRLDPPAAGRTRRLLAGQVPCRTGRYPQGAQLPRNIGFGAGNAHLVQRPVDRSVGRRQLDRRDWHLLSGSYLHQGQILDRDQGERQIRLQPHQGRPRRRRGRGRHLVQESGRILGTDRPVVQLLEKLVLRRDAQIPHPVRQRLQGPHAAEGDPPQEHLHVAGLSRPVGRSDLQLPQQELPGQNQHVAGGPERRIRREQADPRKLRLRFQRGQQGGRHPQIRRTLRRAVEQDVEVRRRFVDPDRLRPQIRQPRRAALPHDLLLVLRLDLEPRPEKQDCEILRLHRRLRQVGGRREGSGDQTAGKTRSTSRRRNTSPRASIFSSTTTAPKVMRYRPRPF